MGPEVPGPRSELQRVSCASSERGEMVRGARSKILESAMRTIKLTSKQKRCLRMMVECGTVIRSNGNDFMFPSSSLLDTPIQLHRKTVYSLVRLGLLQQVTPNPWRRLAYDLVDPIAIQLFLMSSEEENSGVRPGQHNQETEGA